MTNLVEEFKNILEDKYLIALNDRLKNILVQTNWDNARENKNKRLKLGNFVLLDVLNTIVNKEIKECKSNRNFNANNLKLLRLTIQELTYGYINYNLVNCKTRISTGKKLGVNLRLIWNILEPHVGKTRKKFIALWTIYGIGLNNDFEITDNKYLEKIIASNVFKIYYAIIVDDLADNNTLNTTYKNRINELLFIKKVILPRVFFEQEFYNNKQLIDICKKFNIRASRTEFIKAVYVVVKAFYDIDSNLPYFADIKNKMLKEFKLHIDDCITANNFNKKPHHISFKKYLNTGSRGMLMLSFFYTQVSAHKKNIAAKSIETKELIVNYMQKSQRILNDVSTWEREYKEKFYYNSIMIKALNKKYCSLDDFKKHTLNEQRLSLIRKNIVPLLPITAINYLHKIKNISSLSCYNACVQRVLWVGKIQRAFEGEV